jgi:O-Antigen ligase
VHTASLETPKQPGLSLSLSQLKLPVPVLIYLLAVVLPIGFQLGPLALSLIRLFLMIMVIPLTINLLQGKYGRLLWTDLLFAMYILWGAAAIAVNNPEQVIENTGSNAIEFVGGYVLGRAYIRSAETFTAMVRVLALLIIATLPFAFYEALTGHPIVIETIRRTPGLQSFPIIANEPRMGLERAQVVFAHPIHYGLFASVGFSLCLVGLKGIVSTRTRYVLSGLIGLSVFLSLSSGALLSVALQLGLIFWAWAMQPVKRKWLVLMLVFATLYVLIDLLSSRTPFRVFLTYATFSTHNAYWRAIIFEWGIKNVVDNPIFGLGFNGWVRPRYMTSSSVDNFWLLTAMRYGIPTFVFLALGYVIALFQVGLRDLGGNVMLQQFRRAWMFTFIGLSFTLATVHIWTSIYSFVFFLFGAGLWFVTARIDAPLAEAEADPAADTTHRYRRAPPAPGLARPAAPVGLRREPQAKRSETGPDAGPKYSRFSGPPGKTDDSD